jgi:hypothetical protein
MTCTESAQSIQEAKAEHLVFQLQHLSQVQSKMAMRVNLHNG